MPWSRSRRRRGRSAAADDDAIWLQMSHRGRRRRRAPCRSCRRGRGSPTSIAPVLGTRKPAEDGELVVLASGPAEALGDGGARVRRRSAATDDRARRRAGGRDAVEARPEYLGPLAHRRPRRDHRGGRRPGSRRGAASSNVIEGGPLDAGYAQMKGAMMLAARLRALVSAAARAQGRAARHRGGRRPGPRPDPRRRRAPAVRRGGGDRPRRRRHGGRVRGRQPARGRSSSRGALS